MHSKRVLPFVNTPPSAFEQLEVDYADRYKADDTYELPPLISNSPPKPGMTALNKDQI